MYLEGSSGAVRNGRIVRGGSKEIEMPRDELFAAHMAAAGQQGGFFVRLVQLCEEKGIEPGEYHTLFTPGKDHLLQELVEGLRTKPLPPVLGRDVTVPVRAWTEMIAPERAFALANIRLGAQFRRDILPACLPNIAGHRAECSIFPLTRPASPADVLAEIPADYLACWYNISNLVRAQQQGEAGPLRTHGHSYLFYMTATPGKDGPDIVQYCILCFDRKDKAWDLDAGDIRRLGGCYGTGTSVLAFEQF